MKRSNSRRSVQSNLAVFAIPGLLACVSALGLVAALLTDGPLDLFWSALVAAPIFAIGWALMRRER